MSLLARIWSWLTYDMDCGWCHRLMHRAWIPLPAKRLTACGSVTIPRLSHGLCPACHRLMMLQIRERTLRKVQLP